MLAALSRKIGHTCSTGIVLSPFYDMRNNGQDAHMRLPCHREKMGQCLAIFSQSMATSRTAQFWPELSLCQAMTYVRHTGGSFFMDKRNTSPRFSHLNRRQFLQAAAAAGTLAGAGTLLDACGGSTGTAGSGPVTITVMYNQSELQPVGFTGKVPNNASYYTNAFNKLHKGSITVNFLAYDQTRVTSMLAAGTPPDFVRSSGGPDIATLMAKGAVANLQTHFAKSTIIKEDDLQGVNDYYRWDGHQPAQGDRYGMVKDWSQDAMLWYNTDVFKKKGIPPLDPKVPITYDKLLQLGKELTVTTNGKIQVYGLNTMFSWLPEVNAMQILGQNGQQLYSNSGTKANIKDNDIFYQAIKWFVDYTQAKVGPGYLVPETTSDNTLWLANREIISGWGFWYGGSLYGTQLQLPPNAAFAPAPQMGPTIFNSCFGGTGAWIPKKSKNIDAAFTFMEYFLGGGGPQGDDPASDRAKGGFGLPALKHLMSLIPQKTPSEKAAYEVQQAALANYSTLVFSPYDSGFTPAWNQYMPDVFTGKTDLKTALTNIDTATNLAIQQQF
jgi:multiple sugar transport system substrate-binding protein